MGSKAPTKRQDMATTAFARQLKRARKNAGYRHAKTFALDIGVEPPTYRTYEAAKAEPNYATLLRICQQLNLTPNDLLLGKPPGEIK